MNENQNQQPDPAKKESEGEKILHGIENVGKDVLDVVAGVAIATAEVPAGLVLGPLAPEK